MAPPARTVPSSSPSRPGAGANAKRAAKVAERIAEDVIELGWPVGQVFGSEPELLERYSVSRAVFREAVRLVEHQGVARTRRGPGGGLVITEPTVRAVIEAVVVYLHRVDARLDEVFEARIILEEIACEMATGRLDEQDLEQLEAFVREETSGAGSRRSLHALVASATGNPALELFVEVLNRVALLYSSRVKNLGAEVGAENVQAHARIAAALVDGDPDTARRRMRRHLEAEADYFRRRRTTRQILPAGSLRNEPATGKLAESVARRITQTVVSQSMQPGQLVGTESDLMDQQGVSRAVLREAVRILEYHQIARMRRGPGGGLFVMEPSTTAVTDIAALYLARRGMRLSQLSDLRDKVELAIVELAVARIDEGGAARLEEVVRREATTTDERWSEVSHDLHTTLAAIAGNRVLELVALVLIRLSRLHQIEKLAPDDIGRVQAEVLRAHSGIAHAVEAGQRDLALHRMKRHLDALDAVVRQDG